MTTTNAPAVPATLRDVALIAAERGDACYPSAMKEFVDALVRLAPARAADGTLAIPEAVWRDAPPRLASDVLRVHLTGMAEHLARLAGREPPAWCAEADCFLAEPVFFGGSRARASALADTPSAFRRRLLFCGPVLAKLAAATAA